MSSITEKTLHRRQEATKSAYVVPEACCSFLLDLNFEVCSLDGILLERKTFGSKRPLAILIDFQVKILLSQDKFSFNALVENSKNE